MKMATLNVLRMAQTKYTCSRSLRKVVVATVLSHTAAHTMTVHPSMHANKQGETKQTQGETTRRYTRRNRANARIHTRRNKGKHKANTKRNIKRNKGKHKADTSRNTRKNKGKHKAKTRRNTRRHKGKHKAKTRKTHKEKQRQTQGNNKEKHKEKQRQAQGKNKKKHKEKQRQAHGETPNRNTGKHKSTECRELIQFSSNSQHTETMSWLLRASLEKLGFGVWGFGVGSASAF